MTSYLHKKPCKRPGGPSPAEFATTLDGVADRIELARRRVERELAKLGRSYSQSPSMARRAVRHPHDLLCEAPGAVAAAIWKLAAFFRELDEMISMSRLPRPSLPSVYVQQKTAREAERTDVERSIRALVRWMRRNAPLAWASPALSAVAVAQAIAGTKLHDPNDIVDRPLRRAAFERRFSNASTSKEVAVRRAITELVDGLDSGLKRAVRALAQLVFGIAGALDEIAHRIDRGNPTATRDLVWLPNRVRRVVMFTAARPWFLPLPTMMAIATSEIGRIASRLRRLDERLRTTCLTAPYDHAPRNERPEQVLFLAAIKHLERGGFTDAEIAVHVFDGFGSARGRPPAARVRDALDRDKLRDRRTRFARRLAEVAVTPRKTQATACRSVVSTKR